MSLASLEPHRGQIFSSGALRAPEVIPSAFVNWDCKIFAGARFARASILLWWLHFCAEDKVWKLNTTYQKFSLALASLAPVIFYEYITPVQISMCECWRKQSSPRLHERCKNFRWRSLRSRQQYFMRTILLCRRWCASGGASIAAFVFVCGAKIFAGARFARASYTMHLRVECEDLNSELPCASSLFPSMNSTRWIGKRIDDYVTIIIRIFHELVATLRPNSQGRESQQSKLDSIDLITFVNKMYVYFIHSIFRWTPLKIAFWILKC